MTNLKLIGNSILLFLIVFLSISCSSASVTVNNPKEINFKSHYSDTANQTKEIKSESRYPIIEIWQELDGSVPIRGKSLYFRLYDNEVVEFEYELRKKNESGEPPRYTYSIEKIPLTKISEEDFSRFRSLSDDLAKSKEVKQEYQTVALTLDTETKLTIILKENNTAEKKIIINDYDFDIISNKYEKKFPKLLVDLIKEIHSIRVKLQEKEDD